MGVRFWGMRMAGWWAVWDAERWVRVRVTQGADELVHVLAGAGAGADGRGRGAWVLSLRFWGMRGVDDRFVF